MRLFAVLIVLALAACGTPSPTQRELGSGYNEADVMFSQMLAQHARTAEAMLVLAAQRAQDVEIRLLADAVRVTQADEATMVLLWLSGWAQPTTVDNAAEGHAAHGGLPSNGEAELTALTEAADFDTVFINLFVGYQHQAVEYARLEIAAGVNSDAVALAHRVDSSRRAQIEMLLRKL